MTLVVALFGAAVIGLSIFGFVNPKGLTAFAVSVEQSRGGFYLAIGVRVVLGIMLLATASASRFPQVLRVLGVIFLAVAAIWPLLGFKRLRRFVRWWSDRPPVFIRAWMMVSVGVGAFLIYAVW